METKASWWREQFSGITRRFGFHSVSFFKARRVAASERYTILSFASVILEQPLENQDRVKYSLFRLFPLSGWKNCSKRGTIQREWLGQSKGWEGKTKKGEWSPSRNIGTDNHSREKSNSKQKTKDPLQRSHNFLGNRNELAFPLCYIIFALQIRNANGTKFCICPHPYTNKSKWHDPHIEAKSSKQNRASFIPSFMICSFAFCVNLNFL